MNIKWISYLFLFTLSVFCIQADAQDNSKRQQKQDYQIFLTKPIKNIRHIMYEKNFIPIQGVISEDKKSLIMKNYEPGLKVRISVEYEDGTVEEFIKSPCFIDPVTT
jgi:hypothetical protein